MLFQETEERSVAQGSFECGHNKDYQKMGIKIIG